MSLYNALFGVNEAAPIILKIAGLTPGQIPRFRDCYIENGNVVVYTRTGGGNRECNAYGDEDCSSCYHTANDLLTEKPNYLTDYDDDFDSTYAYFVFSPLEEYKDLAAALETKDAKHVGEKFQDLIAKMKAEGK